MILPSWPPPPFNFPTSCHHRYSHQISKLISFNSAAEIESTPLFWKLQINTASSLNLYAFPILLFQYRYLPLFEASDYKQAHKDECLRLMYD
jgi:hypothetical protein